MIMGHRANFIVVQNGQAKAYQDSWAALGCTYQFAEGPAAAMRAADGFAEVSELMDWAFAEGGYLLDFDEKAAIVFGYPEIGAELADFGDLEDLEGLEDIAAQAQGEALAIDQALQESPLEFLKVIAPRWSGWLLQWDDRGVDAFASHLKRRGIDSVSLPPPAHPPDASRFEWRA
jgi:hypothetical protein